MGVQKVLLVGFLTLSGCNGLQRITPSMVEANSPTNEIALPQGSGSANPNNPNGGAAATDSNGTVTRGADGYTVALCLKDLESVMSHAGDATKMTDAEKNETAAAIVNAAARHYPEQPVQTIAQLIISNIRQESDFEPRNVSGERAGSGDAVGLLQISPYGNSRELDLFKQRADVSGLIDYRTQKALVASALSPNDLFDPWLNIHVATWIQSNLGRSGSADPSDWGTKQGPRDSTYLTCLGSWVAGPAADGSSGYGNSGDEISPPYFTAILKELNFLQQKTLTDAYLSAIKLKSTPLFVKPAP